ncbi:uncharacterized protein LOC112511801 isoform X2 [Cynara cardunculus var. scolymus]|uniref:uncharacterized protein LOC112511801 isoform X2 n=1 Tax=Cynara cardunculus var. scolymus TaxID=59895 RepID=UPI000D6247B3|nr:uncharacterized protein LOC112511801 isoform X2 [Cynara cardunculus var. scolymus]
MQNLYCSNQYPKAESYKACNWCLTQKHDSGNSSNSSSSCRNNSGDDRRDHIAVKNKRNPNDRIGHGGLRERRRASEIQLTNTAPIKKLHGSSAEEESPVSTGRKRFGGGVVEKKNHVVLRKSKSANHISHSHGDGGGGGGGGIKTRQVFRNKVRRYKLLDEVSIQ